jgi:hypothetical protein
MCFRQWVYELWLKNCDEHRDFNESLYTQQQYFQMYKYWLRREYRFQMRTRHV